MEYIPSTPMYNPELLNHYLSLVFVGDHAERCVLLSAKGNPKSITFKFRPTEFLRYKYAIKEGDFDNNIERYMEKSYPKKLCKFVKDKNIRLGFWLVFQTYDGKDIVMEA